MAEAAWEEPSRRFGGTPEAAHAFQAGPLAAEQACKQTPAALGQHEPKQRMLEEPTLAWGVRPLQVGVEDVVDPHN